MSVRRCAGKERRREKEVGISIMMTSEEASLDLEPTSPILGLNLVLALSAEES